MTYPTLRVSIWSDWTAYPQFIADLTPHVMDILISAGLHGGIRDIEVVLGYRRMESVLLAQRYNGKRLVVSDNLGEVVAEGTIISPSVIELGNQISCIGPFWDLCFRQAYNDAASWVDAGTTSAQIKDILSKECPGVSSDQLEIEETNTENHPWQPADNAYPGDLIPRLSAMSDSQYREWYFYLKSPPVANGMPGQVVPYFKPQDLNTVHFWFSRKDCPPDGFELTPSLMELANDVRIMYRDAANVQQQTASWTNMESQARYWLREVWGVPLPTVPQAVAEQYRNMYGERYDGPQQSLSFKLNGWVKNRVRYRVPLWEMIKQFPCNIGIGDLDPIAAILAESGVVNREQVFSVAAIRYSYANNTLIVTPDLEERTLENLIALWTGVG